MGMKIGMLTGGGDCPGLNAVIRAAVRKGVFHYHDEFVGFVEGWRGVLEDVTMRLDLDSVSGILPRGGTILRSSRTNPSKHNGGIAKCQEVIKKHGVDALIVLGGDDTQSVSLQLHKAGMPVIGVPKTIDNDLMGTDVCFGFDTAVTIATEAIDRLHSTAEAHNRVIVVEVMGRDSGWIAMYSGIAGGADVILVPEKPIDLQQVAETLKLRHARGKFFSIVVVAEGVVLPELEHGQHTEFAQKDEFGHVRLGGIGNVVSKEIERRTGFESRAVVLGHIQRGGSPTPFDRVLATRYGTGAIDAVHQGAFGSLIAMRNSQIGPVPLESSLGATRYVDEDLLRVATSLQQ
jgi:ATP-dependent phosphofructokinase / diphosphate-dependent phosphofructokinase